MKTYCLTTETLGTSVSASLSVHSMRTFWTLTQHWVHSLTTDGREQLSGSTCTDRAS